jgi:hypothetical protein
MPWPRDVPFCGARRSIAARTVSWSSVGVWTETPESLKATTPIVTSTAAWPRSPWPRPWPRPSESASGPWRHAGRDVEGQDDDPLLLRQAHDRLRPAIATASGPGRTASGWPECGRECPAGPIAGLCRREFPVDRQTAGGASCRSADTAPARAGRAAAPAASGGQMNDIDYLRRRGAAWPCARSRGRGPRRWKARAPRRRTGGRPR